MNATGARATMKVRVTRVEHGERRPRQVDLVAAEEPMEIRLQAGAAPHPVGGLRRGGGPRQRGGSNERRPGEATRGRSGEGAGNAATVASSVASSVSSTVSSTVAVTMRTPGHDFELAAGFLYSEGVLAAREEIRSLGYCLDESEPERHNIVTVRLRAGALPPAERLERHFTMTSACGVCGKAHLQALEVRCPAPPPAGPRLPAALLAGLPDKLRAAQTLFGRTGGLHAAGLFDAAGALLAVREDVGRHNALDKLIGWALLERRLPLSDAVVCVSGRASFELLQKTVVAGAPVFVAVSAPSSLAVKVAERFGVTLIGFLRGERFNVYAGDQRVVGEPAHGVRAPGALQRAVPGRAAAQTGAAQTGAAHTGATARGDLPAPPDRN